MTEVTKLFDLACDQFGERVLAVGDDQWQGSTPCTDWDVRALVHHLVSETRWVPPLLAGKTIAEVGDALDGDLLGDDPKASWTMAAADAKEAVARDGAMERTTHLSFGDFAGSDYTFQVLADLTIHGWDLARAVGVDETIDPDLLDAVEPWYREQMTSWKASGAFGGDVEAPEGSDRQTELLALLGRKAWER
jgi:uncharacterized protein (TIGR03086 family)